MDRSKPFLQAFPGIELDAGLADLMKFVTVERITVNRTRTRMRIYITS